MRTAPTSGNYPHPLKGLIIGPFVTIKHIPCHELIPNAKEVGGQHKHCTKSSQSQCQKKTLLNNRNPACRGNFAFPARNPLGHAGNPHETDVWQVSCGIQSRTKTASPVGTPYRFETP
jgi:hypothetical protein